MTMTPIFDALCREHPNVGMAYHGPGDGRKHELTRVDWAARGGGGSRGGRQARRAGQPGGRPA
jgi:hypothetical protein